MSEIAKVIAIVAAASVVGAVSSVMDLNAFATQPGPYKTYCLKSEQAWGIDLGSQNGGPVECIDGDGNTFPPIAVPTK
jgi:hypothetical protein